MARHAADDAYGVRTLFSSAITTAVTAEVSDAVDFGPGVSNVLIEAAFDYGSGGTSVTGWVQTQLPSGQWVDIFCVGFTTADAVKCANLSARTPVTTIYTATTALTADNTKDGILGSSYRFKRTTVGTYAGTTLDVKIIARGH